MPSSLPYSGVGVDPQLLSALALSAFRVRLTFSERMTANAALSDLANYTLTPASGSAARSVVLVLPLGATPTEVILILDGALTPGTGNYDITAAGVVDLALNPIDAAADTVSFDGYDAGDGPTQIAPGILAGLTSAIGDEVNDLSGGISTRLAQPLRAAQIVQSGAGTLSASSADTGVTVTLGTGTFDAAVAAGHIFRILSAGPVVRTAVVASYDSPTQITLESPGIGENFADLSWQVETTPDELAIVESTIGWPDASRFFLDGVQYRYSSKTADALLALEHLNEDHAWVGGAKVDHDVPSVLQENGRMFSGTDAFWRSIVVDHATGADLDVLGTNLGLLRPPGLPDALYREIIKIVAYSPRGTAAVIRNVLTAVVGADNFDLFEDLTGAREYAEGPTSVIRHPAKVYIRVERDDEDTYAGKTFVEHGEYAALESGLNDAILDSDIARADEVSLIGVRLPADPLPSGIVVARGDAADFSVAATTGSATGVTGTFPPEILAGDMIRIETGLHAGRMFGISAYVDAEELTLALDGDLPAADRPDPGDSVTATGVGWTVLRPWSDIGRHRPSDEVEETFPGSGVVQASWEWTGTATENTATTLQTTARGREMRLRNSTPSETTTYRRRCRVLAESSGYAALRLAINTAALDGGATSGNQLVLQIDDGLALLRAGVIGVSAQTATIGFIDGTGAFIGTPVAETLTELTQHIIRIEKQSTGLVRLYVDGALVDTVEYGDLDASAGAAVDPPGILFGGDSGTYEMPDVWVSRAQWQFETPTEFAALPFNLEVSPARNGEDLDANGLVAEGANFGIDAWDTANAAGGTLHGTWVFDSAGGPNAGTFVGPTLPGARTSIGADNDIIYLDDASSLLLFPHARGHQIELLSGPDAGVYDIQDLLGPDLEPVVPEGAEFLFSPAGLAAYKAANPGEHTPFTLPVHAVRVSNPPSGGFSTALALEWRIVPVVDGTWTESANFAAGASLAGDTVTLPAAVPLNYDSGVYEPIVQVVYYTVPSAQVVAEDTSNSGGNFYPFYLYDAVGQVRDIIDILTAGGVLPIYNKLVRDDAGLHILE